MKIFKRRKLRIGIEIDEVLRSKAQQVEKYYYNEFGDTDIPEQPYVFDFWNSYKWSDVSETIKELKEPDDIPESINPIDYQIDPETGEAPADLFLFKAPKKEILTAKEVYNRFLYEDYNFEIHGAAESPTNNIIINIRNFISKFSSQLKFTIFSIENYFSIPPTLFFLSKINSRFENYKFVNDSKDLWKDIDILISSNPNILENKTPLFKKLIKVVRPYNEHLRKGDLNINQFDDLIDNKEFEKMIKYKKQ